MASCSERAGSHPDPTSIVTAHSFNVISLFTVAVSLAVFFIERSYVSGLTVDLKAKRITRSDRNNEQETPITQLCGETHGCDRPMKRISGPTINVLVYAAEYALLVKPKAQTYASVVE